MIQDRYLFQQFPYHVFQTPKEEMNRRVASLTNEKFCEFLRRYFDNFRKDELEDIDPIHLLQEDEFGQTMLHWAAVKGDVEIIKFIINKTRYELFHLRTHVDQYTALHLAVHGGNSEVIALLIEESKKGDLKDFVNAADVHGQTALHLAASRGHDEACTILYPEMSVSAIALQIRDREQTALHFAVQGGYHSIVQLLLSKDDVARELLGKVDKYGQSVLHWAAGKPSDQGKEMADLLIEKGLQLALDRRDKFFLAKKREGYTALHIAVHSNSNGIIDSLVKKTKGSIPKFISKRDHYGQTALHWAASLGNLQASECLCKEMNPAEINIPMKDRKQTALHFAVQGGHTHIVQLLINNGADISLEDVNGWTALDWARKHPSGAKEDIIQLLESRSSGSAVEASI